MLEFNKLLLLIMHGMNMKVVKSMLINEGQTQVIKSNSSVA